MPSFLFSFFENPLIFNEAKILKIKVAQFVIQLLRTIADFPLFAGGSHIT